jgi:hypothetical protein
MFRRLCADKEYRFPLLARLRFRRQLVLHCAQRIQPESIEILEAQDQPAATSIADLVDARHEPRFKIEVEISINSRTCGKLKGHTVDISESGVSAMLRIEVPLGELVELAFTLPFGPVRIYAVVRQRSAFRYGFQFVESESARSVLQPTCRNLAVEHSLMTDL